MSETNNTLLRVSDLRTHFDTEGGLVKAVDGVSFRVERGQVFALVGESGCGKSVTACSIMRLLPSPPARIVSGRVELDGSDLLALDERQMRKVRGAKISMIFQEPASSLNPVYTCGAQIVEGIRIHRRLRPRQAKTLAIEMLARVGIADPARSFGAYPHQLSGGMQQRVMIAMALSCGPSLLIADEPTSALDVTVQAQILELLLQLRRDSNLGILLITHDLGVVAQVADAVAVMYASRIVELTDVRTLFDRPLHPYTQGLLRALPRLGQAKERLWAIPGTVPDPLSFPSGCKFHPRCDLVHTSPLCVGVVGCHASTRSGEACAAPCASHEPALREVEACHWVACWECLGYDRAAQNDPSESWVPRLGSFPAVHDGS